MDIGNDANAYECRLGECLFFSTAKLSRVFGKIADEAFRKTGLSPSHALILYIVNQKDGMHQKEIGEILHLTPSTITRFIDKLERKRLIVRRTEGKNVYIFTTEDGLRLQNDIYSAWSNLHEAYKDILTEEETEKFIAVCSKLIRKLDNQSN